MKPRISDWYVAKTTELVRRGRYFSVTIWHAEFFGPNTQRHIPEAIFEQFLLPFVQQQAVCYLYGPVSTGCLADEQSRLQIVKHRRQWKVEYSAQNATAFHSLSEKVLLPTGLKPTGLTFLVGLDFEQVDWVPLFSNAWDPIHMTNLGVVVPCSVITFARKTSLDSNLVWATYHVHVGQMMMAFFTSEANILKAYELALVHCQLSQGFQYSYCDRDLSVV